MKFKVGDIAELKVGYLGKITKIVEPQMKNWSFRGYTSKLDTMHSITIKFLDPYHPIYSKPEENFYEDSFVAFYEYFDANDIMKELCTK